MTLAQHGHLPAFMQPPPTFRPSFCSLCGTPHATFQTMKHIKSAGHKASAAIRGASHKLGVGHSSPEGSPNTSPARKKHWYSRTGNRAGRSPETSPRDSGDARRHSRSRSRSAERVPIEALQKHAADSSSGAPRRNSAAPGAPSIAPVSPVSPKSPKSPKPRVAFVEPEKEEKEAREPNFDAFEIPEVEAPSSASAAANGPKGGGDKDIDEPSIFMDDDFEMDDPKAAADRMEDLWSSAPPDEKRGVELATAMRDMLDTVRPPLLSAPRQCTKGVAHLVKTVWQEVGVRESLWPFHSGGWGRPPRPLHPPHPLPPHPLPRFPQSQLKGRGFGTVLSGTKTVSSAHIEEGCFVRSLCPMPLLFPTQRRGIH